MVTRVGAVRDADPRGARRRARHARRRLPVRRVRRAQAARRLGPRHRRRRGPARCAGRRGDSGGTIPDRGLFGVFMAGEAGTPGRRVGELDEEMVYELRAGMHGDVIVLGRQQLADRRDRARPGHGHPGARGPGQAPVLEGRRRRAAHRARTSDGRVRRARSKPTSAKGDRGRRAATARLRESHDLDERAAENLIAYLDDEREVTGALPTDQRIVIERFRDELGDWRICLLTPFGGRVHAPWSMAHRVAARGASRARGPDHLVRRRHRDPAARGRRAPRWDRGAAVPRGR